MPASKPMTSSVPGPIRENTWLAVVPPRISSPRSLMALAHSLAATASSSATGPEAITSAYALVSAPPSEVPPPSSPSSPPREGPSPVSEEQAARAVSGSAVAAATRARRRGRKVVRVMWDSISVGQDLGQEGLGAVAGGVGEELLGVTLLDDLALVHVGHAIADLAGEAHLVGDTSIVIPCSASSPITSRTSLITSGSRAEVGSSKSIALGFIASARAMATRCCCPPDSAAGRESALSDSPTRSSSSRACASASALEAPRTLRGPRVTLSMALRWGNRLKLWNTMPTSERRAVSAFPSSGRGWPSMVISPSVTVSRRLRHRHRVDLPEPEAPISATTSRRRMSRSMSFRAWKSPKNLFTPRTVIRGSPIVFGVVVDADELAGFDVPVDVPLEASPACGAGPEPVPCSLIALRMRSRASPCPGDGTNLHHSEQVRDRRHSPAPKTRRSHQREVPLPPARRPSRQKDRAGMQRRARVPRSRPGPRGTRARRGQRW